MATTGQLTIGEVCFVTDEVKTDIGEWTVVTGGNLLEIISIDVIGPVVGAVNHQFDVRDTQGQKLIENRMVGVSFPVKFGPYPAGARPKFDGLILDTPAFATGPLTYTVVYRPL